MRVLLQWVGKNDFKDDAANPKGPTLQLLNDSEYRERFDRAFLMSNAWPRRCCWRFRTRRITACFIGR